MLPESDRDPGRPAPRPTDPVLKVTGLRKSFPGVLAVQEASFNLVGGEIHAIVGANGAGKSTLIKILTGALPPDAGNILLDDHPVRFRSPVDAQRHGITAIYQEFSLVPALSVQENLFLGRELPKRGLVDSRMENRVARQVLARLGADLDPMSPVKSLSPAQQQLIEIGRALVGRMRVLILDEPTASLSPREAERLFDILSELAAQGIAVIFISHRLDEVLAIADRVTVMRDGHTIATMAVTETDKSALISQMVGRPLEQEYPIRTSEHGALCLGVEHLCGARTFDVSFRVSHGEVLGIAGLVGAGRTELARLIFGADRMQSGAITIDGTPVEINAPPDAIRHGICLLTEDRKAEGLILQASVRENFAIANLASWSRMGWIDNETEQDRFSERASQLSLRHSGPNQRAAELSGGNQQKLLVARWLERNSRVIIFDEPTRGIDVGAKHEMYLLIDRLAGAGAAIVVISSEFPELLGMCDRILVMKKGRIAGEIVDVAHASQNDIMTLAV